MSRNELVAILLLSVAFCVVPGPVRAQTHQRSLADQGVDWPSAEQWRRVVLLQDYNTRVVVIGTCLLGLGSGVVGSYTLLRKRALTGDALAHATWPGIVLAFMVMTAHGSDGKSLVGLLTGAALSGTCGVIAILLIRRLPRIKEDAALGIVLSVFFGAGVALAGVAQAMGGSAAGLDGFIYGKTASMLASDAQLIGAAALGCVAVSLLLAKELKLLCFDYSFANANGIPVWLLDAVLMAMVVAITIIGLQAVGLVLMIALLVIPAAAARFWTEKLATMAIIAGGIGALSGMTGAAASALLPRLPSGAMIVLLAAVIFAASMLLGTSRGVIARWWRRRELNRRIELDHLLRGVYEVVEARHGWPARRVAADFATLISLRSWSPRSLHRVIRRAEQLGHVRWSGESEVHLTTGGIREAERLTRQHRLWELYLVNYADVAPARVDRGADNIEHVLEPSTIDRLEELLRKRTQVDIPESLHLIDVTSPGEREAT